MRKNFIFLDKKTFSGIFLAMVIILSGCNDDLDEVNPTVAGPTITRIVTDDPNFSLLKTAVDRLGLTQAFDNPLRSYTVFAPTDAAFRAAGLESIITSGDTATLKLVLEAHILDIPAQTKDLSDLILANTLNNNQILVSRDGSTFTLNGQAISTTKDIRAANGFVHVVNSVLPVSSQITISDIIELDINFSFLEAALKRAGLFDDLDADGGNFTIFAPTNQAFINAGLENIEDIETVDVADLTSILQKHVLSTRIFASSLTNATILNTLANNRVVVFSSASGVNINNAFVINNVVDLELRNGVFHALGSVIIPGLSILDVVAEADDLSLLEAATVNVSRNTSTNLAAILASFPANGLTLFAPVNSAFEAAGFTSTSIASSQQAAALLPILQYHLSEQIINASAIIPGAFGVPRVNLNGTVYLGKNIAGTSFTVNAIPATQLDILADNGRVHKISNVLTRPSTSPILTALRAETSATNFVRIIDWLDANNDPASLDLSRELTRARDTAFVLFIPTNEALTDVIDGAAAINPTPDKIDDVEIATLALNGTLLSIIRRHILAGNGSSRRNRRIFTTDLADAAANVNVTPLRAFNGTIAVSVSGDVITLTPSGGGASVPANISPTVRNRIASNGIYHVINDVLR